MFETNLLFRIAQLHSPHLLGGAVGRLIVTENDLGPTRQRWNSANSLLNISFLVFTWNDDRYGKVFHLDGRRNHSRNDHLRHPEPVQKWQTGAKAIQKARQQWQILRQKNDSMRFKSLKTG